MNSLSLSFKTAVTGLVTLALLASAQSLLASPQSLPAETSSSWENEAAAGVSLAKGNSDNLSYNLHLLSAYELDNIEAKLGADWHYAENNDVKNTDSFKAFGEYRYLLNDRAYLGTNASYLVDDITDIDYRIDLGVVAGYYLIKNKDQKLSFETGPGYVWQDQADITDDYMTLRFALRYEQQLAQRSKLWFSSIYTPAADDFSDYLLSAEAGIDTAINDHWAIRTAIRYQYDSTPAPDRQSGDTLLTVGLRYALGSYPEKDAPNGKIPDPSDSGPEDYPETAGPAPQHSPSPWLMVTQITSTPPPAMTPHFAETPESSSSQEPTATPRQTAQPALTHSSHARSSTNCSQSAPTLEWG